MKTLTSSTPNVLLVDDNRDGLLVRRSLLEEIGCCVQIAMSGEEGLRLFGAARFDVVVTDYRMPLMNGGELIQRFARHVPVVAFQPVDPSHELVARLERERHHAVFQFSHTHRYTIMPPPASGFKSGLGV